jgi:DNA replication and repair protein RecF
MWLRSLSADRLRNLRSVDLGLTAGLTLVTGRNGHGKTSILEAVYLLSTAHSFRTRKLGELVAWDGGPLKVAGEIAGLATDTRVDLAVDQGEKRLFVDSVERGLEAFLGKLDMVALPGDAMQALRGGPDGRRRFVDSGVLGLQPSYLSELGTYRRVLAERNALLRKGVGDSNGRSRVELDAWDERLAAAASRIHRRRRAYVLSVSARLGPAERMLFPDGEDVGIRYRPSPLEAGEDDPARFETIFMESLLRTRRRDRALGFTADGPHRDDCEVTLQGIDLRKFGSSGQLRGAMVALCAGKLGLLRDERHEGPLFLMDDFDSDLDENRTRSLVEFLCAGGFQAILATSKDGFVDRLGVPFQRIHMEGGQARAV